MNKTGPGQKRRLGRFAYLANVVSQAGEISNVPHEITLDGVRTKTDAAQVFIANFGWMLAGMEPVRPIAPDDGLLDVIVVRASGRLRGVLGGWEALRQKAGRGRWLRGRADADRRLCHALGIDRDRAGGLTAARDERVGP